MAQDTITTNDRPQAEFSVDHWAAFWAKPDLSRAGEVLASDIVGHWPGDPEPVRGKGPYIERMAQVLELIPDLHLEVIEHAQNGDVTFIQWLARGTGADGSFELEGIDRIRAENGLVTDNLVRFDSAAFTAIVTGEAT